MVDRLIVRRECHWSATRNEWRAADGRTAWKKASRTLLQAPNTPHINILNVMFYFTHSFGLYTNNICIVYVRIYPWLFWALRSDLLSAVGPVATWAAVPASTSASGRPVWAGRNGIPLAERCTFGRTSDATVRGQYDSLAMMLKMVSVKCVTDKYSVYPTETLRILRFRYIYPRWMFSAKRLLCSGRTGSSVRCLAPVRPISRRTGVVLHARYQFARD